MKIILSLIALFIIVGCLIVVSILLGFPNFAETLINDFSSTIRVDSTRLISIILILCLIFPFLFLHQAAKIHNKQNSDKVELETQKNQEIENLRKTKDQEIQELEARLDEIEDSKKKIRFRFDPKIDETQTTINFEVKNRNKDKGAMDCKVRLEKLVVFSFDGKTTERFNAENESEQFHFIWYDKSYEEPVTPPLTSPRMFPIDYICEKTLLPYIPETFWLNQIKDIGWDEIKFYIEFNSCEGSELQISSEEIDVGYSVIDIGLSIQLVFDFEDEERVYPYSQRISFYKTLRPVEQDGKVIYFPPSIRYTFSEWKGENDQEN